jgi:hypothetical protein
MIQIIVNVSSAAEAIAAHAELSAAGLLGSVASPKVSPAVVDTSDDEIALAEWTAANPNASRFRRSQDQIARGLTVAEAIRERLSDSLPNKVADIAPPQDDGETVY